MNGIDVAVFRMVNGLPDSLSPFFVFLSEATKIPMVRLFLVGLFLGLVWHKPTRKGALLAAVSWPIADGLTNLLKHGLQWPRPSWPEILASHPDFHVRVEPLTSFGTASAHSANMMAVAMCFLLTCRPLGWVWLGLAVFVGLSRIYVGVHWPSQVLFGWTCGALVGYGAHRAYSAWATSREPPANEEHPEES